MFGKASKGITGRLRNRWQFPQLVKRTDHRKVPRRPSLTSTNVSTRLNMCHPTTPNQRFLPTIYPLNACWLVHRLILTSQPNFGQITKVDYCQFLLKGTKSGQSSLQSTITPEICNTCFKQRVLVTLTRNLNESFDNS